MTTEERKEVLLEILRDDDDIFWKAYREWCENTNRYDDMWMPMEEFGEFLGDIDVYGDDIFDKILYRFWFGYDYDTDTSPANPMREYFKYNAYGNVVTSDYPENEIKEWIDDIADYFIDNPDEYSYEDNFSEALHNDNIVIFNIVWDTEGEAVDNLPETVNVSLYDLVYRYGSLDDAADYLADYLSDEYGWLVESLDYRFDNAEE